MLHLLRTPLLLASLLTGSSAVAQVPVPAPDGERGLGAESSLQDILRPFRQPTDEDQAYWQSLTDLEGRIGRVVVQLERNYAERGLFEVLEERKATLQELHRELERFLPAPGPRIASKAHGAAWAELFLDTRARVRARVLDGWREDAQELRQALTLLRANDDGWVRHTEPEAQLVAARADLAAALLRARLRDLEALREEGIATEVSASEVEELIEIARSSAKDADAADELQRRVLDREAREDAMAGLLFTARLRTDAADLLAWREKASARAAYLRQDVRLWRPDTEEGKDAPANVRSRKKTDRRRAAFQFALEGLANDPFDAELTYAAGYMAEFVGGRIVSVDYYDRFLCLRGMRSHDDRNWRKRELTDEEKHALFQVQQFAAEIQSGLELPPE